MIMSNATLLTSSVVCTVAHLVLMLTQCMPLSLSLVAVAGCATSLANHWCSSPYTRWADRLAMACCLCADTVIMRGGGLCAWLAVPVSLYVLSKVWGRVSLHVLAHLTLTAVHTAASDCQFQ